MNSNSFNVVVSREMSFKAKHSHHGMLYEPNHEHTFTVRLTMEGNTNSEGFLCDFRAVKRLFFKLLGNKLHGANLDDWMEYPTSENLAKIIWTEMNFFFPLKSVSVSEKPHSIATYSGTEL